jgi:LuxR family maltose regulon positive regulatory protein
VLTTPILQTKLHCPTPPPSAISRPQLMELLDRGVEAGRQISLVSAPAGFGKTTCISEWAGSCGRPVTWLSLDPADNDPGRFLAYLVAALQAIDQDVGSEALALLGSGQALSSVNMSTTLINGILMSRTKFTLVLDDLQVIQSDVILQVLERLATSPPPNLHLIAISRDDPPWPLARLRANNQLTEIRAKQLRFSLNETVEFLARAGASGLSREELAALEARTEGWVASLQLAVLAMRGRSDAGSFVRGFTGSHAYVADYLMQEVLSSLSDALRTFLMRTSILRNMNAGLCDAVTGRSDSQEVLQKLLQDNMFLVPLDGERTWFRYHHLFADLLQSNLKKTYSQEEIAVLHSKATAWYQANGHPIEAIRHALAAQEFDQVATMIDQVARSVVFSGQVDTLGQWLEAMPESVQRAQPRLRFYRLWVDLLQARIDPSKPAVQEEIEALQSLPSSPENIRLRGEVLAVASRARILSGKLKEGAALAEEALTELDEADLASRARVHSALSAAYWFEGEQEKARVVYQDCIEEAVAAGDLRLAASTMLIHGLIVREYGRLHEAADTFQSIIDLQGRVSTPPSGADASHREFLPSGLGFVGLGTIHLEWNDLDIAKSYLEKGIELSLKGGLDGVFLGRVHLSRLLQARGELTASSSQLELLSEISQRVDSFRVPERQVQIHAAMNDLDGVSHWAEPLIAVATREPWEVPLPPIFREIIQSIVVRVYLFRGELTDASRLLDLIEASAGPGGRLARMIDVHLQRALLATKEAGGRVTTEAVESLQHALGLAAPEGFTLVFLEEGQTLLPLLRVINDSRTSPDLVKNYAQRLIQEFAEHGKGSGPQISGKASGLVEALTPREMEVLELIAAGDSNQDIAEKLFITVRTVKKHAGNIYGKLGAGSRTHAVARAREIGLLSRG